MSSILSPDLTGLITQYGFPIAVCIYLLWERTKTFAAASERWDKMNNTVLEVVKANTVSHTELKSTIQKLCEIINGLEKKNG